jgi:hypothetical protein
MEEKKRLKYQGEIVFANIIIYFGALNLSKRQFLFNCDIFA